MIARRTSMYRITIHLVITVFVALLLFPSVSWGLQESLRTELIDQVRQQKPRFADLSAELSVFTWRDEQRTQLETTEYRRILQWKGKSYDCVCKNSPQSKASTTDFHFQWNDAEKLTGYFPPDRVTIHRGKHTADVSFEPYDILLKLIGAEQTLLELLSFDGKAMDAWKLELVDDNSGPNIVSLRAVRQLPGSKLASVMELKLSKDHAYLPIWGQMVNVISNVRHVKAVVEVTDFRTIEGCGPLFRRCQIVTYQDDDSIATTGLVELQAERLRDPPPERMFFATSFVGNPEIINYEDDREISRAKLRPARVKKTEPWPPFMIWLVMNDVIAGVIVIVMLVRFIIRKSATPVDGRKET